MTQADLPFSIDAADALFEGVFKLKRARKSDPKSSHLAAEEIAETAESQCARILAAVKAHPDLTTQELAPQPILMRVLESTVELPPPTDPPAPE